jgi:hypothetical protein
MIVPRQEHVAAVLSDGKVLIAGGDNARSGPLAASEDYDYETGKFTQRGSMHARRARAAVAVLRDGSPLVTGGTDGAPLDSAETYDVLTGKWTLVGKMTSPRVGHTATLLPDGRVLIVGGGGKNHTVLPSAEIFDPKTKQFTAAGEMHQARFHHAAVLLTNGKVLIAGGTCFGEKCSSPNGTLASAELYDPATHTFTQTGNLNEARTKLADCASLLDGRALIVGGAASAEIFDPRTGAFRIVTGTMDAAHHSSAAIQLMDGSVRIFGGYDSSAAGIAKTWIYRP